MARSISLAAYRALSARGAPPPFEPPADRPQGALIWGHATSDQRLAALRDLGARLQAARRGIHMLITRAHTAAGATHAMGQIGWIADLPVDHPGYARAFLDHWQPDLCFWTGGHLHPNLIRLAGRRGVRLLLIDADETGFDDPTSKWLPGVARETFGDFAQIMAASNEAAERMIRLGAPPDRVLVTGRLRNSGNPLPCDDDMVSELTEILAARPVWLAAHVQPDEVPVILAAHREASRLAHRLLLVLVPADPGHLREMLGAVQAADLRCVDWTCGEMPDENTQVLVSEGGAEMGLWYRIAPLTLMASSLTPGYGGRDPFDAAALGSAVIYGPNVRDHLTSYSRLAAAGAARIVKDAESLGGSVTRLIAPDHAATMALAGWEVVSEGAHLTDQLLDIAQDVLDRKGRR